MTKICLFEEDGQKSDNTLSIPNKVGGSMPPTSVSFGCGPPTITMGGCSPNLPIVTSKICDPPNITTGDCSNSDSNGCAPPNITKGGCNSKSLHDSDSICNRNNITTLDCKINPDYDSKSDTKCTPNIDSNGIKCETQNDSKSSDSNDTKCCKAPKRGGNLSIKFDSDLNGENLKNHPDLVKSDKCLNCRKLVQNTNGGTIDKLNFDQKICRGESSVANDDREKDDIERIDAKESEIAHKNRVENVSQSHLHFKKFNGDRLKKTSPTKSPSLNVKMHERNT